MKWSHRQHPAAADLHRLIMLLVLFSQNSVDIFLAASWSSFISLFIFSDARQSVFDGSLDKSV